MEADIRAILRIESSRQVHQILMNTDKRLMPIPTNDKSDEVKDAFSTSLIISREQNQSGQVFRRKCQRTTDEKNVALCWMLVCGTC